MTKRALLLNVVLVVLVVVVSMLQHTTGRATGPMSATTCRGSTFSGAKTGSAADDRGGRFITLTLTKESTGTCVVGGFPLLTLWESRGVAPITFNIADSSTLPGPFTDSPPRTYAIRRGGEVSFELHFAQIELSLVSCAGEAVISRVDVQLAVHGAAIPIDLRAPLSVCENAANIVGPFVSR